MRLFYFEQLPFNERNAAPDLYSLIFDDMRTRWTSQLALFSQLLDAQYDTNQTIHLSADPYDNSDDDTDDEMPGLIDTWDSDSGYGSA
ncbi:hypothetical protein C8J56DRAFT_1057798 [Mycena floridula]|nr:hypothetical protein C8J56DRAFT_1057798 [Mycena floridula]